MPERKNPTTSNEAYRKVSPEMLNNHHGKIIKALKEMGSGIYTEIAEKIGMEKTQVGRRLVELQRMNIVYKPGGKKNTPTSRSAYVYKLVENNEQSAAKEKVMQGKTVTDFSRELIQKELF